MCKAINCHHGVLTAEAVISRWVGMLEASSYPSLAPPTSHGTEGTPSHWHSSGLCGNSVGSGRLEVQSISNTPLYKLWYIVENLWNIENNIENNWWILQHPNGYWWSFFHCGCSDFSPSTGLDPKSRRIDTLESTRSTRAVCTAGDACASRLGHCQSSKTSVPLKVQWK